MKANPAQTAGTGRKKRMSTLPGAGDTAAEKIARIKHLRALDTAFAPEYSSPRPVMLVGSYRLIGGYTSAQKREILEKLPTSAIMKLSETLSTETGEKIKDNLLRVLDNHEWLQTFNSSIEDVLLDVVSYYENLGIKNLERAAPIFKSLYKLTDSTPGSLAGLTGRSRKEVEALLLVISSNGHFSGHTFRNMMIDAGMYIGKKGVKGDAYPEFPQELASRIMANPDCAETLIEYMNKNMMKAHEVNWVEFTEYLSIAPALREGAL